MLHTHDATRDARAASDAKVALVNLPQWTADIDVDAAFAKRAIAWQFRTLEIRDVVPFGSGWDNAAFLVNGELVFRFPRRRTWAESIEREIAILPEIAGLVPLPISAPSHVGVPTDTFPWHFAGYPVIAGSTACALDLQDDERTALAKPLGDVLRALHAIDPQPAIGRGLPPDRLGRLDSERRLRASLERVATLREAGEDHRLDAAIAWLTAHPPAVIADGRRTIVHGDLYPRHLILDERMQLRGVIDWGDVHFGDPAIDLAIAHMFLPSSAHTAFRNAYGAIDDRTWDAARYRALYHAILELDYGIRTNDAGMRRIGRAALRLIADEIA
jgi:aminoglycoside phosphotransferase (APT) family kinase protein